MAGSPLPCAVRSQGGHSALSSRKAENIFFMQLWRNKPIYWSRSPFGTYGKGDRQLLGQGQMFLHMTSTWCPPSDFPIGRKSRWGIHGPGSWGQASWPELNAFREKPYNLIGLSSSTPYSTNTPLLHTASLHQHLSSATPFLVLLIVIGPMSLGP